MKCLFRPYKAVQPLGNKRSDEILLAECIEVLFECVCDEEET